MASHIRRRKFLATLGGAAAAVLVIALASTALAGEARDPLWGYFQPEFLGNWCRSPEGEPPEIYHYRRAQRGESCRGGLEITRPHITGWIGDEPFDCEMTFATPNKTDTYVASYECLDRPGELRGVCGLNGPLLWIDKPQSLRSPQ